MPQRPARIIELDILRAVAIIIIVFSHFGYFLPTVNLSKEFAYQIISYGIALFLFISGFVLHLNHPSFTQHNSLADFYKKRVLRIFPLYWLAIAVVYVQGYHYASPINALVVIFGLQGFLAQTLADLGGWWFIGVIIVLYAIYPLITTIGSVSFPPPMESNALKFAIMLIVPFLILYVANARFFLINGLVLAYYGIFVLGVAVSKYDVLSKYGFLSDNRMRLLKYIVVAAVSFAVTLLIFSRLPLSYLFSLITLRYLFSLIMQNALFLLFVMLAFCLARIIVVSSSKASPPLSRALWYRVLLLISFSSYAIYLFFLSILVPLMYALLGTQLTGFAIDIIQIFVGLPIVVLVAYLLQRAQNEIVSKIRKYRTSSEPRPDRT